MLSSWEFWLILLLCAVGAGIFLTWIEKKSKNKMIVGQPSVFPTELVDALTAYFKTQENVKAAYLAQLYDGREEKPPHPVIGIDAADDFLRIQEEAGNVIGEVLKAVEIVDIIPMGSDPVSDYMRTNTRPFYP